MKAVEEFYKPHDVNESGKQPGSGGEVINFESLMNDEEDYGGED